MSVVLVFQGTNKHALAKKVHACMHREPYVHACAQPENTNSRGRLSTIDLLIEVACFATQVNNIFNLKMS